MTGVVACAFAGAAGAEGLRAGAVAWGDFAVPLATPASGTHPVSSRGAAASASRKILGAIINPPLFNPFVKPMPQIYFCGLPDPSAA